MNRLADHPIAHDRAAVHFYLWQTDGQASAIRDSLRQQAVLAWGNPKAPRGTLPDVRARLDARKQEAKRIRGRHYGNNPSGLWTLPHAVALSHPFRTACGVPYAGGMQVPSIWEGSPAHYVETRWFELLDIRAKCLGCSGAIGRDPTV